VVAVAVLGPVELRAPDGGVVRIGSVRQRRLLAALALRAGAPVPVDALAELVWGDDLPADPSGAVQTNVARLRRLLPDGARIETDPAGYRLDAELDVHAFESSVARAAEAGDPERRAAHLDAALLLWRGRPFADLDHPDVGAEAVRLAELRATAVEARAEALLDAGRADDAIAVLEAFVADEPLRERPVGLLMRALTAAGRQADALRAYARLRDRLVDELGLDPSAELRAVEAQVLRQELPATAVRRSSRLPLPVSSFVGRDADVAAVAALLERSRVVTLCGPGGVGKSRLALHAADAVAGRYDDGVVVVPLGALAGDVDAAVAGALRVSGHAGEALVDRVAEVLAVRRTLLVLDDCEHVLDAVAALGERLVAAAPGLDVLTTTREPLRADGEHVHVVAPLAEEDAVALLADRADAAAGNVLADAGALAEVARRLDGLPLAIELAAARLPAFGVAGLAEALDAPFDVLRGGRRGSRHRSLLEVVEWSYAALAPDEQLLFDRFSVFAGGADAAAISAVCGAPAVAIADLVERSLVTADAGARPTYAMLDTLRAFGRQRLAARGELADVEERHTAWAAALGAELVGTWRPAETSPAVVQRFDAHVADLRLALGRLVAAGRHDELEALAALLAEHALYRGRDDLVRAVDEVVASLWDVDHRVAARIVAAAGNLCWQRGDLEEAERRGLRALAVAEALGDPGVAQEAHECMANVHLFRGEMDACRASAERAFELAEADGRAAPQVVALVNLLLSQAYAGDTDGAAATSERILALAESDGAPLIVGWACYAAGEALAEVDPVAAAPLLERALAVTEPVDLAFIAGVARHTLVTTAARRDEVDLPAFGPVIDHWHRAGAWTQLWLAVRSLAEVLARRERWDDVVRLIAASRASARASELFGADAARQDAALAAAAEAVGDRFAELRAEGEVRGDEGVVAFALGLTRRR
jgi:predicted ATPase/DNA-binding SARP family transcriptional activator